MTLFICKLLPQKTKQPPMGQNNNVRGFPLCCVVGFFFGGHEKWQRKRKSQENGNVLNC